jgi:hypothetical protein|nr:MAG TPA: hypothetical protein [Caudoviricetes sp.]
MMLIAIVAQFVVLRRSAQSYILVANALFVISRTKRIKKNKLYFSDQGEYNENRDDEI